MRTHCICNVIQDGEFIYSSCQLRRLRYISCGNLLWNDDNRELMKLKRFSFVCNRFEFFSAANEE